MKLYLCFCVCLISLEAFAADPDLNGRGFDAYQKKDYKKSLSLFTAAIEKDPKNSFAWLNQARAIVALNNGKEPVDFCDFGKNWKYLALHSLVS